MAAIANLSGPVLRAPIRARWVLAILVALAMLAGGYALVLAQVSGDRGIAPTASSSDIEVRGVEVDVTGDDPADARSKAWREAARKAWSQAGGPAVSDGQLNGLVSAIVIQRERVGPKRYVATLGVSFDRQRAGRYLGGGRSGRSSAPMLLIPVTVSGGSYTAFEVRNPWQRAWAEFNPGTSRIDYVRPSGAGGDSLLLNYGQAGRRSRAWWRLALDQYGAADALVPIAKLEHQFPGGPIKGTFTARYGPDSVFLDSFSLDAEGPGQLPEMLSEAVDRIDRIYEQALVDGKLMPDPTLRVGGSGQVDPAIARLIQIGRAIEARNRAEANAAATTAAPDAALPGTETPAPVAVNSYVIQFATPDPATFDASLSTVRQVAGVRGVSVTSTAMGGTSVMQVGYAGELSALAAELRGRGFTVREGANALAISR
ncbi:heavy-metal-associated domain-containing protein [uncultured Erythrobacter sp.]|uniref:heavy-metal-associated domain-containing protein n=1 Tax=uncultured Erythrobacter sp. TaxID=263913 RepID=UPI00260DE8D5|nr:heavy-metal-associated domain-containing protein [uncultured Erythrobacter sp.]